mmetsp:Transcript_23444/g.50159  ORF Transcript_23444/g.50159 Transcript_23444/m.50159 type:complete len:81 (+) Transcript_23444:280-522(+)
MEHNEITCGDVELPADARRLRSEFESSLRRLAGNMESGLTLDIGRVVSMEEEYRKEFTKGTITQGLTLGLEILGNTVSSH